MASVIKTECIKYMLCERYFVLKPPYIYCGQKLSPQDSFISVKEYNMFSIFEEKKIKLILRKTMRLFKKSIHRCKNLMRDLKIF